MKTFQKAMLVRGIGMLFVLAALLILTTTVLAKTRTDGGGDLPFYARIEREYIVHTDELAVIIFYQPPDCVPEEFNLLDFFDFETFSCTEPTTDGFIIWSGEPWITEPSMINLRGEGAVPVWFISWDELQDMIEDDELTIVELVDAGSLLMGEASLYTETLHPTSSDPDVVKPPMINYVAQGTLEDGRSFYVHALSVGDDINNVQISFK